MAFVAASRAACLVAKDPQDPERRLFLPMKSNLAPAVTGLAFRITDAGVRWDKRPVRWTADEIIGAQQSRAEDPLEREDAKSWLQKMLRGGPQRTTRVFKEGKENGYSESTLKRAKAELGVEANRRGGLGSKGYWEWSLPAPAKEVKMPKKLKQKTRALRQI
jgi:hypothetical protein